MVLGRKQRWSPQNSILELVEGYDIWRHSKAIHCRRGREPDEKVVETSLRTEGDWVEEKFMEANQVGHEGAKRDKIPKGLTNADDVVWGTAEPPSGGPVVIPKCRGRS